MKRGFASIVLVLAMVTGAWHPVRAADFPSKPIHIIVPVDPGGGSDLIARIIAQEMTKRMGQPVIVDNKPGAASTIGADFVAHSPPDGYTILIGSAQNAVQESVYAKLPYDFGKDFRGISTLLQQPYFIAVANTSPIKTLAELIAAGKSPDKVRYGTAGIGTMSHLGTVMFNAATGAKLVHVPYRSTAEQLRGILTGEIQTGLFPALDAVAGMQSGSLRLLAVTSPQRSPAAPNIPTVAELGYPNYAVTIWFALFVPSHTPDAVVNILNKQVIGIIAEPAVQKRLSTFAAIPYTDTPAELDALTQADIKKYAAVVKAAGIKPQ